MYCTIRIRQGRLFLAISIITAFLLLASTFLHMFISYTASTSVKEGAKVPIIMYHSILKDSKRHGKFVISPDTFENDLKYLTEHGYTTIVMQDLIDYVNGGTLPEKPVMLTFDDGYSNNYLYAYPLLQKYGCKMVLSPIVRNVEESTQSQDTNPNYAQCSWDQLKEMSDSGLVELQNHSYNMHTNTGGRNGTKKKKGESDEAYRQAFTEDVRKAQEAYQENIGKQPTTFAYPFGAVSNVSVNYLKEMGFQATLTCENKMNYIRQEPEALFGLYRFLRPSGSTSEQFFSKVLNS